jgi:hypothetical protein
VRELAAFGRETAGASAGGATGERTDVQAAALGSTAAIRRYVVTLDGRRVADLTARRSPFDVSLRRRGRRVRIVALGAGNRVLASAQRPVTAVGAGKRGASGGGPVGA